MAEVLELNVRAKPYHKASLAAKRRNDMAMWRKKKQLVFMNNTDFQTWLDYTKWHKRPYKAEQNGLLLYVTFLDNMKGAK